MFFLYPLAMIESKVLLWQNVTALMLKRYEREHLTNFAKDVGISPGTATRIKVQATSVGIDVLDKIAAYFKIESWQLLAKNLGVDAKENHAIPPEYHDPWPFELAGLARERYEALPLPSKHAIQTMMRDAIAKEELEVSRTKQESAKTSPKAA